VTKKGEGRKNRFLPWHHMWMTLTIQTNIEFYTSFMRNQEVTATKKNLISQYLQSSTLNFNFKNKVRYKSFKFTDKSSLDLLEIPLFGIYWSNTKQLNTRWVLLRFSPLVFLNHFWCDLSFGIAWNVKPYTH
jgi:hypothetical protein